MQDGTVYNLTRDVPGQAYPVYVVDNSSGEFGKLGTVVVQPHPDKPKLTSIKQRTGDTIFINGSGIYWTNTLGGVSSRNIYFDRDSQNRITAIHDPISGSGGTPVVKYIYNQDTGNLIQVLKLTDRATGSYQTNSAYHYDNGNFPHYITSIDDGRGIP